MLSFSAAWRSERPISDRNRFSINFAAIVKCQEYDTIVLSGSVRISGMAKSVPATHERFGLKPY